MSQGTATPIDLSWMYQLLESGYSGKAQRAVALVPAHNEQDGIVKTVKSLQGQTVPLDLIMVMADNCTDETVSRARAAGAYVVETRNNSAKKAGALNQGIALTMPWLQPGDYYVFQDADGELAPNFLENAIETFRTFQDEKGRSKPLGGLSGAIVARSCTNFVERAQAIEYARGTRLVARKRGKVHVLSGAASVLPVTVLQKLAVSRGTTIPGEPGAYFMEDSLTEDYELTLAIRHLGYDCTSTRRCPVITDVMPTVKDLEVQRLRWFRGALESLWLYGWNRLTWFTWLNVLWTFFSSLLLPATVLVLSFGYLAYGSFPNLLWWAILIPIFAIENIIASRRVDRTAFWLAVTFVSLWVYANAMFIIYWRSWYQAVRRSNRVWIT